MTRFVAVTACPTGVAHTFLAAEALEQAAVRAGHLIQVETQGSLGTRNALTTEAIAGAEAVIIAADIQVATERFQGKLLVETGCEPAIRTPDAVLGQALDRIRAAAEPARGPATPDVVAITSCPTGIAHTFMAAEGLEAGAKAAGHTIKVETQGSVGAQNALTAGEIAGAQVVVIAADTKVDKARFQGKRVYETSTNAAISDGAAVVRAALAGAQVLAGAPGAAPAPASGTRATPGAYRHLMTGVSHMLPFVTAGGLLIALAFAFGGIYVFDDAHKGTLAWTLFTIGAKSGFALMVPVLAGFIAHSIADRAGLAPGMIGGMIAVSIGAGFFGGIAAGFLAGYTVRWLNRHIRLGRNLDGLKPVLILPLLGTLVVGLLMYLRGGPAGGAAAQRRDPLAQGAAGFQRHPAGPAAGVHDGLRHGRAHQQGGLHVRHRADRQRSLRAHGRGDGRGDDRSLGRCPGHRAVPEPVHRRGAGSGQGHRRPGPGLHHRRGDPLRRQGPLPGHPLPDAGVRRRRRPVHGPGLPAAGAPRRLLRPAHPQRGPAPGRLPGGHRRRHPPQRGGPGRPQKAPAGRLTVRGVQRRDPNARLLSEPPRNLGPVEVFQEGVDVVRALDAVVHHEGVLPAVQDHQQVLLDGQAQVVLGDEVGVQLAVPAVAGEQRPAGPAQGSSAWSTICAPRG